MVNHGLDEEPIRIPAVIIQSIEQVVSIIAVVENNSDTAVHDNPEIIQIFAGES